MTTRPTETGSTPYLHHFYHIVVSAPETAGKIFTRNIPLRNPAKAMEMAIRDILNYEGLPDFGGQFIAQVTHITTTDPELLPFDPDQPEG